MITIIVLGVLVGTVLGMTGAGGGIFAVPALVYGLGWGVAQASPVALMAVAVAAAVGTIEGMRKGLVRYKAAILMAIAGVLVTSLGLRAAQAMPEAALLSLFALAMIIVAFRMYRSSVPNRGSVSTSVDLKIPCRINPSTGRLRWTVASAATLIAIGLVSGFLTGLLGVGGGFVIVPALKRLSDIIMQGVIATSLMVIALVAGGAVFVSWWHGAQISQQVTIPFVIATAFGMIVGRVLVSRIPAQILQRAFALLMVVVACSFLWKATSIRGNAFGVFLMVERESLSEELTGKMTPSKFGDRHN